MFGIEEETVRRRRVGALRNIKVYERNFASIEKPFQGVEIYPKGSLRLQRRPSYSISASYFNFSSLTFVAAAGAHHS